MNSTSKTNVISLNRIIDDYIIEAKNPLLIALIVWLSITFNYLSGIIDKSLSFHTLGGFMSGHWTLVILGCFTAGLFLAPIYFFLGGIGTHILFYFSKQNKNRSYLISCRFAFLIQLPFAIISIFVIVADLISGGHSVYSSTVYGQTMNFSFGSALGWVLLIPASIASYLIVVRGGPYLTGASKGRIFFVFFILPLLVVAALIAVVLLFKLMFF